MENENLYNYVKKNFKFIFLKFFIFLCFFGTFYTFIFYLRAAFSVVEVIKNSIEIDASITKNLLYDFLEDDGENDFEENFINEKFFKNINLKKNDFKLQKIKEFCSRICIRYDLYVFLKKMNTEYELSFFSSEDDLFLTRKKRRLEKEILKYFKKSK